MESAAATITGISIVTIIVQIINVLLSLAFLGGLIYLFVLLTKALRKYLRSGEARKDKAVVRKSLGETLKGHRVRCKMTQEFVAERLGVSRQAVSKWENGVSLS